jgi:T5SS/PEP-CTERM-associated repeat protein/autotransporter-associated beta strand protein
MPFSNQPQKLRQTSPWRRNALLLLTATTFVEFAHADRPATFWMPPSGDFFDSANWSLGSPGINLDAKIDNGGVVQINYDAFQTIPYVYLGSAQNKKGTLEVVGPGVASFTTMIVGALNATGILNILDGGKLTSFGGPIGSDYLGVGIATVDGTGSSWKVTGSEMVVGGNGIGSLFVQNNGSFMVANGTGRIQLGNHPVSGGTIQIGNGGVAGTIAATEIYNGEGDGTVIFNHNSPSYVFSLKLTGLKTVNGFLNIEHNGPGTTILTAAESNLAGSIVVSSGTLIANGRIMGSTTQVLVDEMVIDEKTIGTTSVLAGGTLGGTGFIEGNSTLQGTLSPGTGIGVLKFGRDLSLSSTSTVKMEIGGDLRGTQFDGVDIAGALLYAGKLSIVLLDGFAPDQGDTFQLFN